MGDEDISVGVVGAGLTGILMGIRLKQAGFRDFTIYEQAAGVGGTWLRNTYPGLHCDVPSHLYCYSFEPNPAWSLLLAPRRRQTTRRKFAASAAELDSPASDGLAADFDSAMRQQLLDITDAQGEAKLQPHPSFTLRRLLALNRVSMRRFPSFASPGRRRPP